MHSSLLLYYLTWNCIHIELLWNSGCKGHLVSLAKGNFSVWYQHFQRISETIGPIIKFHMSLPGKGGTLIYFMAGQIWSLRFLNGKKILLLLCSLIWKHIQIEPLWDSGGQGHLVTWQKVTCQFAVNIFKGLVSETIRPISDKIHMQPPAKWEWFGQRHMTKMAAMFSCKKYILED